MSVASGISRSKIAPSKPALSRTSAKGQSANQTYAEKKAQALSAKNTVIMTYDELERIKSMCSNTNE